jgi:ubiquinone/menaquinone biosynthesis C-methylase UbiE
MHTKTHKKFINPESVLFQAGLKTGQTVSDLGAGSGYYALAGAKIVGTNGHVHVADVKDTALDHVATEARMHGHKTVKTYHCDLDQEKLACKIPEGDSDMVVLANIMHEVNNPKILLKHAYSMMKTGGKLVVVDWNDRHFPIGPAAERRLKEQDAKKMIEACGLRHLRDLDTDDYHYGMVFEK